LKNTEMKKMQLPLPKYVEEVCLTLEKAGFSAYVVGGCVRDLLLGKCPQDYDVTTAARPADIKRTFSHTVDTGISHGTVTVVLPEGTIEVTTFRADGTYSDNRRPDSVSFLPDVNGDLARRDFTVNAMAYGPARGFCDPFSGREDLQRKILRAVGTPVVRFEEDALRILRLYRFAAQLSFCIEEETARAAEQLVHSLSNVSRERIFAELQKLLQCAAVEDLQIAKSILAYLLPQADLTERNLEKTAACTAMAGKWAQLCGEEAAETLRALRAGRKLILSAEELAAYQTSGNVVADVAALRYTTRADFFAFLQDENKEREWNDVIRKGAPESIAQLAITGADLQNIGFCGREIGAALQRLFVYAIENPANNKKEILREVATWIYRQKNSPRA